MFDRFSCMYCECTAVNTLWMKLGDGIKIWSMLCLQTTVLCCPICITMPRVFLTMVNLKFRSKLKIFEISLFLFEGALSIHLKIVVWISSHFQWQMKQDFLEFPEKRRQPCKVPLNFWAWRVFMAKLTNKEA